VSDAVAQAGTAAASVLALVLSLANLYLQRRDRSPRLRIRVRYEYRAGTSEGPSPEGPPPRIHDGSQEGLYPLLGAFLREHGLAYPEGSPVVRFSLSNEGQREIFLDAIRLVFRAGGGRLRRRETLVLDPVADRVLPLDLAEGVANVFEREDGSLPVRLAPGDSVGYKFELVRLANTLKREGHAGNVRLALEVTDRLGHAHRRPFDVNTDLWAYPEDR
jgi:hypothetical protein